MANHKTSVEQMQAALDAHDTFGHQTAAAEFLGLPRTTFLSHLDKARNAGLSPGNQQFEAPELPSLDPDINELLSRRKAEWDRQDSAHNARKLIDIKVKIDGPYGIAHFGDPHVDDPGTNIALLEADATTVRETNGMFGGCVGDLQNNWVGRLARLYGEQSTSHQEAWKLTEWFVNSVSWLYLTAGNHDLWSGAGDPLKWMMRTHKGVYDDYGCRLNLKSPNGKQIRVNARHDFRGHSMWNPNHGAMKAIQLGWRDHVLTCGHKHVSAYGILKCPATGLVSHAIRVAGYKIHDRFGKELGLPDGNFGPSAVTIINPEKEDTDAGLITTFFDVQAGADYLNYLRKDL